MFSEAFVSHLFSRGWVSLIPGPFQGVDMASPWSLLGGGYVCGGYVWGWVCLGVVGLSGEWACLGGGYPPPPSPTWDLREVSPLDVGPGIPRDSVGKREVRILPECFFCDCPVGTEDIVA